MTSFVGANWKKKQLDERVMVGWKGCHSIRTGEKRLLSFNGSIPQNAYAGWSL